MSLSPGQILDDKYRIVRVLGIGGMGAVYEGENTRIHRRVAIKVLHASVASKEDIVKRFEREAQAAGRIGSQHIVEVLDLGKLPTGERFMVMEYLDGEPLTQRIKVRGKLHPNELAPILLQLLDGLGGAHHAGIIHRDLKPDNVYLVKRQQRDFVKLLDFGVSKFSQAGEELSMTKTGAVMGTPYYMSPEQARGQAIDHRSDLYSVGVVAYQCLTGRVPFNAETFNELIFKIALETPEPVERVVPNCDPGFASIVRRSMERDPAHRFQTAGDFARALSHWQETASGVHPLVLAPHAAPSGPGVMQPPTVPGLARSDPSLSSNPLGTSAPALGVSGSNGLSASRAPLGDSHPHAPAALGASGAGHLLPPTERPPEPMAQSQVALAVTTGASKKSMPVVLGVIGVVVLGAAAFGIYQFRGRSEPKSAATSSTSTPASEASAERAAAAPTAAAQAKTAEPEAPNKPTSATAVADVELSATPIDSAPAAASSSSAPVTAGPIAGRPQRPGVPAATLKPAEPPPASTAAPTAKPTPGGRTIDDKL